MALTSPTKLSDEIVMAIRRMRDDGVSIRAIAGRFGIDYGRVSRICSGRVYKHLPTMRSIPVCNKLTEAEVLHIHEMAAAGSDTAAIAKCHRIRSSTVLRTISGMYHKRIYRQVRGGR